MHDPADSRRAVCPVCRRLTRAETRPFCSTRCAEVDLGRWFGEQYRLPAEDAPEAEDTAGESLDRAEGLR